MLYNKRGALTTKQIVVLIILIISFLIILFLIFRLNLGGTTKKEICRDSVILRGKSLLPTGVASLNCKTQYVCLSMTNSCDKIDGPDEIIKVKKKDDVYKALADKMADCWWMFGEGKINYVGKEVIPDFYCSICSQLYFDSSIKKGIFVKKNSFSQEALYDYIVKNKVKEEGQEYDEYLYEGLNLDNPQQFLELIEEKQGGRAGFANINLDKPQIILMGTWSKTGKISWVIGGITVTVLTVTAAFFSWITIPVAVIVVAAGTLGATAGYLGVDYLFSGLLIEGKSGVDYLRPIVIEKDSEHFKAHKCDEVVTLS